MTRAEGTFFVSVKDTLPRDFSASRARTRTHFAIQVKIRSILGKYGELRDVSRINETNEGYTQASSSSFGVHLSFSLSPSNSWKGNCRGFYLLVSRVTCSVRN